LLILLLSVCVFAEDARIVSITVKGNQRIDTAAISLVIKSKAGEPLSQEKVSQDIKEIYKLGYFEDVKVESERSGSGIILSYLVIEKPIVREIRIVGNKEIKDEKIRDAIILKPNSVFSTKDLTSSEKKVKKLYTDEGYYLADVSAKSEKKGKNELRLVFTVSEGKKVLIKTIRFEGNKAFSARKLRKAMQTKEKWFLSWLTGAGAYKEEVLKNDVNLIADLYFNKGYINAKIGDPEVKLLDDKSGLDVTIRITEGEQFKNGDVDFKGDLILGKEILKKQIKMKKGEIFSRAVLREDVVALTDKYTDKGYAFANVTPLSKIDPNTKTIDITFEFEKGNMVFIEKINITGNSKTRDKVIRRQFKLAEGDLYSSGALKRTKQNLTNLGYFEEVNIASAKGSADNKLNLNAEVKEKSTGKFSIGGGYSSADGPIGQASIQQDNFLGLGLKAILSGSIGGETQTYTLGLTDPYFRDTKWTLGGDIYRTEREYTDYDRRVTGADIKAGYPLTDDLNTYWLYRWESKDIFNQTDALDSVEEITQESSYTLSSIYASLSLNTTDFRLDPTKGTSTTLSVEYAGPGGNARFIRYIGESAVFFPFKWNTVFSLRGTLGYLQRVGRDIPIDENFYLGGINTIRGYETREVAPYVTTPDGIAFIGGNKQAVFNAEYVFPILKEANIKGLFFFDTGNAYAPGQQIFSTMRSSYGFGVRWYSPMGPLRLEYGIPVNPRPGIDSSSGKLEFSIGGFF
jgi:outer membrane protein insertion porin family